MKPRRDGESGQDDSANNLGLLYTGYLDKQNPVNGSYHVRFVVLTHDVLHWFKRSNDGQELFGEERGHVGLDTLLTVRVIDEDSTCFEVQSTNNSKRYFRGSTPLICEEWVSAIRSAHKGFIEKDARVAENHETAEVLVNLVTVKSKLANTELVISRNPAWDRMISIPSLSDGDSLLLTTTNGGTVSLSYDTIAMKCEDGMDFEVSVQSVPLDACLRISLTKFNVTSVKYDSIGAGAFVDSAVKSLLGMISKVAALERNLLTLVLSSTVLIVSFLSVPYYSPNTSLLFIFSSLLSFHNISRLFLEMYKVGSLQDTTSNGLIVTMIIHGHTFLSPDATKSHDDDIPQRFIDGCEGDLKEARRRWDITRNWRETEGVNTVLQTKQPYFTHIKSLYPFYHAGRGREGHIVFYERPGDLEVAQVRTSSAWL